MRGHVTGAKLEAVNFFGHAATASWTGCDPVRCLGAMLPDFATMARAQLSCVDHPALAAGVDFHHAVDRVFHGLPSVRGWMRDAAAMLGRAGVARGPALGAAHVGVELLLDGELTRDDGAAEHYLAALACAADARIDGAIVWQGDGRDRWQLVRDRLGEHGVPTDYRDPAEVARRLARILAPRPRLRLAPGDEARLAEVFAALGPGIAAGAASVERDLRTAFV